MTSETLPTQRHPVDLRLHAAIEAGQLGIWDLRHELETVHYSPQWKLRFGFPEPDSADSTHFWQCRVHPDDLTAMVEAMRAHANDRHPHYEARFRLRSNGSGYRLVHSRGRIVERDAQGRAQRAVGVMIDLTDRPATPREGLSHGPRGAMAGLPITLPFHLLLKLPRAGDALAAGHDADLHTERHRLLAQVDDLLHEAMQQLDEMRNA
ncbi:PAS domain-containing protein [Roseateles amylovorans]|uniref:histidine kinase n=1 Tax=Roseateles amylovorans TaxID=2978473 RepID=A0ABY6ATH4_9BURK|nr:PAS domain-containing protein [Roseateles amylovorans]UXH76526.1 PAS domain-containing protein [Roseateles amylovorans]